MFDQAIADKVCEGLRSGLSERKACKAAGTSRGRLRRWLDSPEFPELRDQYARATAARARMHAGRIESIAALVETGAIAPDAARVSIDARKWLASRMLPKVYGDKLQVDQDLTMRVEVIDPCSIIRQSPRQMPHDAGSATHLIEHTKENQ